MSELKRIDTPSGRFYETPEGFLYPSVTTVLSSIPNPDLHKWRESIGEAEADRISRLACTRGTQLHEYCELYLRGTPPKLGIIERAAYRGLHPILDRVNPLHLEFQMYSNALEIAGTMDCCGEIDGIPHIIDWKTTSRLKHNGEFDSYWIQTAFYSAMLYERTGVYVPRLCIVMQDLSTGDTQIFYDTVKNWLPKAIQIRRDYRAINNR